MSERQAKRLRRAQRAYIRAHKTTLETGPTASASAAVRGKIIRTLWPRLTHRGRGVVGRALTGYINPSLAYSRGLHFIKPSLDAAICALGVAVPS